MDALDAEGTGLVCIWSWGLPFLPGDRARRLRGDPPRTGDRPSLNLALYERGRQVFYTLRELEADHATWDPRIWRFGDSTFEHHDDGDRRRLVARFDVPIPGGGRLDGELTVEGRIPRATTPSADPTGDHLWTPLLGASIARGAFRVDGRPLIAFEGSGYHDRNGSHTALDALGIDWWTWGRQVFGDTLLVHYLTWPEGGADPVFHAVITRPDGSIAVEDVVPEIRGRGRGVFGMRWPREIRLEADGRPLVVRYERPVDDGPFYLRHLTHARWGDAEATGWAEVCRPDRIDLDRHRFLVNMAVDREGGATSMWLPLFVGPRSTRVRRLVRRWTGRPLLAAPESP